MIMAGRLTDQICVYTQTPILPTMIQEGRWAPIMCKRGRGRPQESIHRGLKKVTKLDTLKNCKAALTVMRECAGLSSPDRTARDMQETSTSNGQRQIHWMARWGGWPPHPPKMHSREIEIKSYMEWCYIATQEALLWKSHFVAFHLTSTLLKPLGCWCGDEMFLQVADTSTYLPYHTYHSCPPTQQARSQSSHMRFETKPSFGSHDRKLLGLASFAKAWAGEGQPLMPLELELDRCAIPNEPIWQGPKSKRLSSRLHCDLKRFC